MKKKTLILAVFACSLLAVPAMAAPMSMELGVAEQIEEPAPVISGTAGAESHHGVPTTLTG